MALLKRYLLFFLFPLVISLQPSIGNAQEIKDIDFNRDIRPILSDKCILCHGPDDHGRQADLRLDQAEAAHEYAFVPGDLDGSEGWSRILSDDPDSIMPPPSSHKELDDSEKALLKAWIQGGARYEVHWAFDQVQTYEVPEVDDARFATNEIDRFAYQRMQIEQLRPSEEASREVLIRRVTLDLTGLPPTVKEIDDFVNDQSPDAYAKVVERLLASPRYGERMAVDWLDIARYGDTSVFHADGPRDMWRWRDWVVDAYNSNMSFDQFTLKQLAGDLLPNKNVDDEIASGFNRNNASTDEGGAIAEEFRVEYAVDRVKTTSMVWLGLSMECAQCHDHKYDPISQEEYYKFFAFFNQASDPGMQTRRGNQRPTVDVPNEEALSKVPAVLEQLKKTEQSIAEIRAKHQDAFLSWVAEMKANPKKIQPPSDMVSHLPLDGRLFSNTADKINPDKAPVVVDQSGFPAGKIGKAFQTNPNSFIKAPEIGKDFTHTTPFSFGCWVKIEGGQAGAVLARMNDGNAHRGFDLYLQNDGVAAHFIHAWPGNALKVIAKKKIKPKEWHHLFVTYNGGLKAESVKIYVNGEHVSSSPSHNTLSKTLTANVPFTVGRRTNGSPFSGLVDDVRVYDRELNATEVGMLAMKDSLPKLIALDPYWRTQAETEELKSIYLERNHDSYRQAIAKRTKLRGRIEQLKKPLTTVMVMRDLPKPRMTYVLDRGQYDSPNKEKPVEPGVPGFLPELSEDLPKNRLGMAKWIVDPNNPLTSRVAVNRIWKKFFGIGIVESIEDFGFQGMVPSHPEMLDWLASDFVRNGWDVKRLVKQIVMSQTYRQSSRIHSSQLDKDPANRYLSRGPRFRLAGEFLRDQALAVAGILNGKIGGPGVKPYQPSGLWNEVSLNGNLRFVQDKGDKLYRRSLYTYWKRSSPPPSMVIFDAPSREKCTVRRGVTNTPLQALVLMNDPQFVEASRMLAERIMKEGGASFESKVRFAYKTVTSREPSDNVMKVIKEVFEQESATFTKEQGRAKELLKVGEKPRDESLDLAQHAAWTVIANLLFNLDEVVTRG